MPETPPATILLVDDQEPNRYAVSRILRKAGYAILEAGTGEEALALAARKPDLVILDVNLPDLNGYEVCRQIKGDPATASVLVLHLSATMVESEARAEGLEGGADGYLVYPLESRELLATVQALLRVRAAERAVRAQGELLRVTLGSIGDGVVATDPAGVITFINPVAQELTGWADGEALGRPLADVFRIVNEETGAAAADPVAGVIQSGTKAGLANHTLLVARDGARRPIDDSAAPIHDDRGQFVGVVLVFRDVTERRRLEREVRRRSDDLEDRDRRKDEFLAMLAHELRNPLAPLRNGLELVRVHYPGDPLLARLGGMMGRQVSHMVRLVDDLLDVSRITRGKIELRMEPTEVAAVVERTLEAVRPLLDERRHHLEVSLPGEPLRLRADPARLEQVLANLLTNAAKYTEPGGHVALSAAREGGEVVVRVRDDGIGIRPEMLPRLFDLFQQADRVPGRVSEGLGIGLTLVRNLVELHGGTVSVTSAGPGRGSEFTIRLPAGEAAAPQPAAAPEAVATVPRPLRLLVTDDNVDAAESLAMLLRLAGHEVRTAHDGPQTLAAAREFLPQVVFMDIGLPGGMDGYEVARRLRAEPGLGPVRLVAMTGYGQSEDVGRALAAGFDQHLTKPAELADIRKLLTTAPAAGY